MSPPGGVYLVSALGGAAGSRALAATLACAAAGLDRAGLLVELGGRARVRPGLAATAAARRLEERLASHLPERPAASRGSICHLSLPGGDEGLDALPRVLPTAREGAAVIHLHPSLLREAVGRPAARPDAVLLRSDLGEQRSLTALVVRDLRERGLTAAVAKRPLGWLDARLALAGALGRRAASLLPRRVAGDQRGQALLLGLGASFALLVTALALVAIAGAITGKGRVQRAADLAAISAARSMRDDLPRLTAPPTLPNGLPNPRHLPKPVYLARARAAALQAARGNGVDPGRVAVSFPDAASFAPVRVRAVVRAELEGVPRGGGVEASAVAEAAAPAAAGAGPPVASGGGYGGPLAYRQGEGMRPDVAAAFDRMAAAARADGVSIIVNSGFRSDAEQAALFAANPDPRMVAPPGKSLHRCATELDLGPASAYGWLAANARRFGFVQRYSWEAWHYGFVTGPDPCSAAGESGGAGGGDGIAASAGVPHFVPGRYRGTIARAASRWNVSAALLAAQLMAESGFDPGASSPAGAQGIAQFMPATAAAYGLRDPFDPERAIDAQAHLMSDLLRRFRAPALALAAYNAGPAPVEACGCVPAYPETRAYVSRILALLGGAGALALPAFEVRLVE